MSSSQGRQAQAGGVPADFPQKCAAFREVRHGFDIGKTLFSGEQVDGACVVQRVVCRDDRSRKEHRAEKQETCECQVIESAADENESPGKPDIGCEKEEDVAVLAFKPVFEQGKQGGEENDGRHRYVGAHSHQDNACTNEREDADGPRNQLAARALEAIEPRCSACTQAS